MKQEQVIEIVKSNNPQKFDKYGDITYRIAEEDFVLETIVNGEKETQNNIKKGDVIVKSATGIEYVPGNEKFYSRYILHPDGKTATPKGSTYGNYYHGSPISFTAIWGEAMICNDGDYLGSPDPEFTEAYRIEREEFEKTYKPA
jgi:hypothetical protein